ncbi:hypothetical protein [Lysobacter arvi]|uniref:Uncharacterized protein n=1 Tax=Lysobacter arvi TaxID=3038776 RepID=A0ABU1CB71_9GAMM|nr:hypothetical protein [Lysobacter arvi]MDR0182421.1 hypothetical protein [Lysobacter arvi]
MIKKSLQPEAQRLLKVWWKARKAAGSDTGSAFRVHLMRSAERPLHMALSALATTLVVLIVTYLLSLKAADGFAQLFTPITSLIPRMAPEELRTASDGFMQAQAALAALSFPIAIAFAALSHDKEQRTTTMEIYFVEAAVLLLALSSFAFIVALLAFQGIYELAGGFDVKPRRFFCALMLAGMCIWMTVNLALTSWFTIKTFEFLSRDGRRRFLAAYAVQAVRSRAARSHIMNWLLQNELSELKRRALVDWNSVTILDRNYRAVQRIFSKEHELIDANPRQLARLLQRYSNLGSVNRAQIQIPPHTWHVGAKSHELVLIPKDREPSRKTERAIAKCFTFRTGGRSHLFDEYGEYVATVLGEARSAKLRGDSITYVYQIATFTQLMQGALYRGFDLAVVAAADRHILESIPANADIWTFLRPAKHFVYEDLIPAAVRGDGHWFLTFTRELSGFLTTQSNEHASTTLQKDVIQFMTWLVTRLSEEWRDLRDEHVATGTLQKGSTKLKEPYARKYEKVLSELTGLREHNDSFLANWQYSKAAWNEAAQGVYLLFLHCESLAISVHNAIALDDLQAAEWWTDCFIRWPSQHGYAFSESVLMDDEFIRNWITASVFEQPQPDHAAATKYQVIRHFWQDARIILLAKLVAEREQKKARILERAISSIVSMNPIMPGGHINREETAWNAPRVLSDALRMLLHSTGSLEHTVLASTTESLLTFGRPHMVTGRLYSAWGSDDASSLLRQILILVVSASVRPWSTSVQAETLLRWLVADEGRKHSGKQHLTQLLIHADELDHEELAEHFGESFPEVVSWPESIRIAKEAIAHLIGGIERQHADALNKAPLSDRRLSEIARAAEATAFAKESGGVGVRLFQHVEIADASDGTKDYTLRIAGVSRAMVVDIPNPVRPINEEEWLAKAVRDHVSRTVMLLSSRSLLKNEVQTPTPESYFAEIQNQIRVHGSDPDSILLLTHNQTSPEWLWQWRYPEMYSIAHPENLWIDLNPSSVEGLRPFIAVNGVKVVRAPVSSTASLSLPRNAFRRLIFSRYGSGSLINAQWHPEGDGSTEGVLQLSWRARIEVAERVATALVHDVNVSAH